MPDLSDRHGYALSTRSPVAAERYVEGLDRQLSLNAGGVEGLSAAVEADPGFALGHADLAFARWYRQNLAGAKTSLEQARALDHADLTPRERRHIEIVGAFLTGQTDRALALAHEHLAEFPRDGMIVHLASMTIAGSGRLSRRREAYDLLTGIAPAWADDWWFLGAFAFAHHELDRLEEARRLAERSLEQQPRNAAAAHPLAHVFFESNAHGDGVGFLGDWITAYDRAAPFFCHLNWHLALFELMEGNTERVLQIYDAAISPAVGQMRTTLVDAAALLWRYEIYGCQPKTELPWAEVCSYVGKAAPKPGVAFLDAHAALVFAAMNDRAAMARLIEGLEAIASAERPVVAEVILPLARGIDAFGQGAYDEAVGFIEPIADQLVRVGGSHAQFEVFEDTLLQAYLRSGRFEGAEALLRKRLARRSSARDVVWLEQATAAGSASSV